MFLTYKNKKGQNTAEYAILIALVVASIVAMQTYAQRALQGRQRDIHKVMQEEISGGTPTNKLVGTLDPDEVAALQDLGQSFQYEPYYLESDYDNERSSESISQIDGDTVAYGDKNSRSRAAEGYQKSTYSDDTSDDAEEFNN